MIKKFRLPLLLILSFLVLSNTGSSTENNTLIVTNTISKSSTSCGMTSTDSNTPSSATAVTTPPKGKPICSIIDIGCTSKKEQNIPNIPIEVSKKIKDAIRGCHPYQYNKKEYQRCLKRFN